MKRLGFALALVMALAPLSGGAAAGGDWYVVAFDGPIRSADRTALEAGGAKALQYRHPDAYVAWMDAHALRAARSLASVRSLPTGDRFGPALAGRGAGAGPVAVWVASGALARARVAVGALAPVLAEGIPGPTGLTDLLVTADEDVAGALATLPEVLHVGTAPARLMPEDEQGAQIVAGNIGALKPVPGYEAWLAGLGLDGTGVRVSIVDTGVDENHPDLSSRVVGRVDYGAPGAPDTGGHGTHVAGIVAGVGADIPGLGRLKDGSGFHYGLGVAPRVELVNQNALDLIGPPLASNLARFARDAVRAGSVAWNASWQTGEGVGIGYTGTAATLDGAVRDADGAVDGAEPLVMVFSAGNSGPSPQSMTAPHEAKNIIAVASTQNSRALGGSIDRVSNFSSRGPAADGRIGPTVSAPGETVISARSLAPGVACNVPSPLLGFGFYATCSGTSMAAPHVTGAVALVFQWWRARTGVDPSPALVKALLTATATDMGIQDAPNGDEGWGRVNVGALFDPVASVIGLDQGLIFDEQGAETTVSVVPADPSKPLGAMLVWTDAPGAPGASRALVNDLDLSVEAPEGTYLGNNYLQGSSVLGGAADRLNNVEGVEIASPSGGLHTVRVRAFDLPGNGVPGGDGTDQDFALVLTNAILA